MMKMYLLLSNTQSLPDGPRPVYGTSNSVVLGDLCQHCNDGHILLRDDTPEVVHGLRQRCLHNTALLLLVVVLLPKWTDYTDATAKMLQGENHFTWPETCHIYRCSYITVQIQAGGVLALSVGRRTCDL